MLVRADIIDIYIYRERKRDRSKNLQPGRLRRYGELRSGISDRLLCPGPTLPPSFLPASLLADRPLPSLGHILRRRVPVRPSPPGARKEGIAPQSCKRRSPLQAAAPPSAQPGCCLSPTPGSACLPSSRPRLPSFLAPQPGGRRISTPPPFARNATLLAGTGNFRAGTQTANEPRGTPAGSGLRGETGPLAGLAVDACACECVTA